MKAGNNYWNYIKSSKYQHGFSNEFASYETGLSYNVSKKSLNFSSEYIIVNSLKRLLGQRKYTP